MKKSAITILIITFGAFCLSIIVPEIFAVPPANDNFANAQVLASGFGSVSSTNIEATKEAGEPNHGGNPGGRSVWYKWTHPSFFPYITGYTFTLRNAGTNYNTLLAVYTGTALNNLSLVAGNDNYGRTVTSTVYFPAVPGTTYYIAIDGAGADIGNFTLTEDINKTHSDSSRFAGSGNLVVSLFRPSNGTWYVNSTNGFQAFPWGQNGDIPVPADFDGDLASDYAVFRNGKWYVLYSSDGTFIDFDWGQSGDKPVPGDYNSDGLADYAVFRPSNGTWYVSNGSILIKTLQFGQAGDKPAPRDFDMDGGLDFTVFRPSNGTWYILRSRDNSIYGQQWGASEDIPVPGGYQATGRADIAVWRPSTGVWYAYQSANNNLLAQQFGQAGDIPQPINYGTDTGLSDLGIYRPSTGTWYIFDYQGTVEVFTIRFGASGDIPTATAYPVQ